jgi:hypothetical protein
MKPIVRKRILDLLQEHKVPMTARGITEKIQADYSSVYVYLKALARESLVRKIPRSGHKGGALWTVTEPDPKAVALKIKTNSVYGKLKAMDFQSLYPPADLGSGFIDLTVGRLQAQITLHEKMIERLRAAAAVLEAKSS